MEIVTPVRQRRRWSRAEKERIVAAAVVPGAVASEVARAAGIHLSQLSRWRHELRPGGCSGGGAGVAGNRGWAASGGGSDGVGGHRDRVCEWGADADHRAGRRFGDCGRGRGAGENTPVIQ